MTIEISKEARKEAIASIEQIQLRVSELDIENHEAEFQYWRKRQTKAKR